MAAFCAHCVRKIMGVPGRCNDFALPLYWPFPAERTVLCEGCGWVVVDPTGWPLRPAGQQHTLRRRQAHQHAVEVAGQLGKLPTRRRPAPSATPQLEPRRPCRASAFTGPRLVLFLLAVVALSRWLLGCGHP